MPGGLDLTAQVFHQWQCDHYGHVNTRAYAAAFDDAIFAFWSRTRDPSAGSAIPVTAEMKTAFVSEAAAGTVFAVRGSVVRVGTRSVTLRLEMSAVEPAGRLLASCDVVEVFFDPVERRSAAIPDGLRAHLTALLSAAGEV